MNATRPLRAALYARVSTNDQTTDNQLLELRRYVEARGWTARIRGPGRVGGEGEPPALDALLKDARRRRFDVVVCWSLDRIGRSLKHGATATAVALASSRLGDAALRQLFLDARSQNRWLPQPVDDAVLRELYELARMAPTAANSQPMRLVFLTSGHAKERLRPALAPGNVEKTMTAPAVAIVAHDLGFYDHLPALMPHVDARAWFASKPADEIRARCAARRRHAGRVSHPRRTRSGPGLRPHRGVRPRPGRRDLLPGRPVEVEFHPQPRLRGYNRPVSAQSTPKVRGRVPHHLIGALNHT